MQTLSCVLILLFLPGLSSATKLTDVPGYTFSQLTDNDVSDFMPRVSSSGMIAWIGRFALPGSSSPVTSDFEVFFWNGFTVAQLTDDGIDQDRVVVNNHGDLAWQDYRLDARIEIVLFRDGQRIPLTSDDPPWEDRYPDINDRGVVVWGRRSLSQSGWRLAIYDPDLGLPYTVFEDRFAYRPHINSSDHIEFGEGYGIYDYGIYDLNQQLLTAVPKPATLGYSSYRRSELNDSDQLAIEADAGNPLHPDFEGPRDILFWDGLEMNLIYRSAVWAGRADLNADGVIAWEGYGGLPGSTSTADDLEIFVYDPSAGVVLQLTDDDVRDIWPTVTADGTVVWMGQGGYPGATSGNADFEVLLARPDGAGGQCGDVSGDDLISGIDVNAIRQGLAGIAGLAFPGRCNVIGDGNLADGDANGVPDDCAMDDVTVLQRFLAGMPPEPSPVCAAVAPPAP